MRSRTHNLALTSGQPLLCGLRTFGVFALLLALGLLPVWAGEPRLPLLVWDVTFNDQPLDAIPHGLDKEQLAAWSDKKDVWPWLPLRSYRTLTYVTRTRQARVVAAAAGLTDKPLLLTFSENAQPQYGPQLWFEVPWVLASQARRWHLSLDVAKGNVSISCGFQVGEAAHIAFHEDGTVRANDVQIARYAAGKPLHLEFLIDVPAKTVTITVNGDQANAATLAWRQPKAAAFQGLRIDGLLPGGHGQAPGILAVDNIKLEMLE